MTNNGEESHHAKITTTFKSSHPNIWNFCETLNDIITDTDIDIARLNNGLDILGVKSENKFLNIIKWNHVNKSLPIEYIPQASVLILNNLVSTLNQYIIQITRIWHRILRIQKMIFQWGMFQ